MNDVELLSEVFITQEIFINDLLLSFRLVLIDYSIESDLLALWLNLKKAESVIVQFSAEKNIINEDSLINLTTELRLNILIINYDEMNSVIKIFEVYPARSIKILFYLSGDDVALIKENREILLQKFRLENSSKINLMNIFSDNFLRNITDDFIEKYVNSIINRKTWCKILNWLYFVQARWDRNNESILKLSTYLDSNVGLLLNSDNRNAVSNIIKTLKFDNQGLTDSLVSDFISEHDQEIEKNFNSISNKIHKIVQQEIFIPISKNQKNRNLLIKLDSDLHKNIDYDILCSLTYNGLKPTVFFIHCSNLFSQFVGESEKCVRNLFNVVRKYKFGILWFDCIDLIASVEQKNNITHKIKTTLLLELDSVSKTSKEKYGIIATSTKPLETLDSALTRSGRFDTWIKL